MTIMVPAEMVDEQVGRREDGDEEPDDERDDEERDDEHEGKDRQRRAHQEPDEHARRRPRRPAACQRLLRPPTSVLLEYLGARGGHVGARSAGDVSGLEVRHGATIAHRRAARVRVGPASTP